VLDRAARLAQRAAEAVCTAMFAAVFLIFLYKIALRYLVHDAVAWADEVSVVLFIWIIFVANGLVVEDRRQICFDLLYRHVAPPTQRVLGITRILLVGGILAAALPGAIDYIAFLWRERTPVLLWRLDLVYACFAFFMVAVLLRMAATLVRLLTPRWRDGI
jgi:TRAP-type C4-dicarboxylate transport system permease small subunit